MTSLLITHAAATEPAGYGYLFILAAIAFIAPLLGFAIQICFGWKLPRKGDWLPVGMLFISFLCGAGIFHRVILEEYDPNFAVEYRFNWFDIMGDGGRDALGTRAMDDAEYAATAGANALSTASTEVSDAELDAASTELSAFARAFDDWPGAPSIALAPKGEEKTADDGAAKADPAKAARKAAADFAKLPRSLRKQVYDWAFATSLRFAAHYKGDAKDLERLLLWRDARADAGIEGVVTCTNAEQVAGLPEPFVHSFMTAKLVAAESALTKRADNLKASDKLSFRAKAPVSEPKPAPAVMAETPAPAAVAAPASPDAVAAYVKASQDFRVHAGEMLPADASVKARALLVAAADAEQTMLSWSWNNITDETSVDYIHATRPPNLRNAPNGMSQAFAIGIYIDNVTAVVLLMVTLLAFLIHLFSVGYMAGDARYSRFFANINLFTAGMIGLVISNNFLWLFICWEIMGLCSYLLIGHYFEKTSAQQASLKAFFTTRIADTFMFIGMMMIFAATGTTLFTGGATPEAAQAIADGMASSGHWMGEVQYAGYGSLFQILGSQEMLLGGVGATAIGLLCFIGPAGKSAQFPFHVWLPDAMEGPTPVSAMIHAACMVSAGVYLTARLVPLFTPDTLAIIAVVGGFTALAAGTVGLVQTDLKKVLAYSTISQLGYMFMGIGVGAWYPALFHMLTHAFFKALMFLGSGSVILGCHHEQEMPRMGRILRKMPITGITFWVGTLSIIGLPFFFAGYYSKEAILVDSNVLGMSASKLTQWLPFVFGILGAGLTTFYMLRLMWLTFHGKPRDQHLHDHVKESPWTVVLPLVVIAIGAFVFSWPIGAAPDATNLGVTHIKQIHVAGAETQGVEADGTTAKKPPQAPNESWLAYLWRKPSVAYSEDFIRSEYPAYGAKSWEDGGWQGKGEHARDRIDALYADGHGRPQFANAQVWRSRDLKIVNAGDLAGGHGDAHGKSGHEGGEDKPDGAAGHGDEHAARGAAGPFEVVSNDEHAHSGHGAAAPEASHEDRSGAAHAVAGAGGHDGAGHDANPGFWADHDVHEYHELHHGVHNRVFMMSLVLMSLAIGLSIWFYLGPFATRDWVGHDGFRFRVKETLRQAYRMDNFYAATILRANRWARQFAAWFDRVVIDGVVNFFGWLTVKMCRIAERMDYWGVDGSVRGVGNVTSWAGRQARRSVSGRIQDYVFLLVAGVLLLYIIVMLMR